MDPTTRTRLRAGVVALAAGAVLLAAKFWAWWLTGSTAVYSDAMESIVNVVAAAFALGAILFAARPADANHPYGHGKIEFMTAAFEGGLVAFAAVMILYEGVRDLVQGPALRELDAGLLLVLGAGAGNGVLGLYLLGAGRRTHSPALEADGKHVLSDALTSLGILVGLLLVRATGALWLDPAMALVVGSLLAVAGVRLVRQAAGGLLDEEDPKLMEGLAAVLGKIPPSMAIEFHETRAIRSGASVHVDAHVVVPEFWTVEQGHDVAEDMERRVLAAWGRRGEVFFHLDPCRRAYCARCRVEGCAVRAEAFASRPPVTRESIAGPPFVPGGGRAEKDRALGGGP